MAKALVVVESPAKAKTINKYLGRNYKVVASMGHVRDLPKSKLGVDIDDGFEPSYEVIASRKKVLKELKDGWEIAGDAAAAAGGGATLVLEMRSDSGYVKEIERLQSLGWAVHLVADQEGMVRFARAFSQAKYEKKRRERRG